MTFVGKTSMPQWGWRNRHDPEGSFWSKVDKSGGPDACWPWMAAEDTAGYGAVKWGGKKRGAHTVALELKLGRPITPGMLACHTRDCVVRLCCNPAHLYEGTYRQNAADTSAMGRHNTEAQRRGGSLGGKGARGEQSAGADIQEEAVLEIYRRAWAGDNLRAMGRELGVSYGAICDIKHGRSWAWLTGHDPSSHS